MRKGSFLRARSLRANRDETMRILARAGKDNEPVSGDELPDDLKDARKTKDKEPTTSRKHSQQARSRTKKARG